jgi:DNA polymerase III subunit chi
MTEIAFHFNVPDRLTYTCRLVRKAYLAQAKIAVLAAPAELDELDSLLWRFSGTEFLPHSTVQSTGPTQVHSPILLIDTPSGSAHRDVLINLSPDVPAGFEQFARLIEVVTASEEDRQSARPRWKHYAQRGYAVQRHDLAAGKEAA